METNCGWSWSRLRGMFVMLGLAAAALATHFTVEWLFAHEELRPSVRHVLVFLPILAWIFFVVAFVQMIRRLDELVQRIFLHAAAIGFLGTVVVSAAFDELNTAGIFMAASNPAVEVGGLLFTLAAIFLAWRYR